MNAMHIAVQAITHCLWFDSEAEQAAGFYAGIFKNISHRNDHSIWEGGFRRLTVDRLVR